MVYIYFHFYYANCKNQLDYAVYSLFRNFNIMHYLFNASGFDSSVINYSCLNKSLYIIKNVHCNFIELVNIIFRKFMSSVCFLSKELNFLFIFQNG